MKSRTVQLPVAFCATVAALLICTADAARADCYPRNCGDTPLQACGRNLHICSTRTAASQSYCLRRCKDLRPYHIGCIADCAETAKHGAAACAHDFEACGVAYGGLAGRILSPPEWEADLIEERRNLTAYRRRWQPPSDLPSYATRP